MSRSARALRTSAWVTTLLGLATAFSGSALGKLETWRQENSAAFSKGHRERVVVSDNGRVRLGQSLNPFGTLAATRVWDLARTADGTTYAATGDEGKVFRRGPKEDGAWDLVYDAADTQALSLAVLRDGHVVVGTGPTGQLVDVTETGKPVVWSSLDKSVQYVWDMAVDAGGNLYAATGPTGQLWKRTPDGKTSLLFDSKHSHLLCVAVGPDGDIYAGSDGEGLIYRVTPSGKASVLYDGPQNEIRSLVFSPDGSLYAGTAAESSSGSSSRAGLPFSGGTSVSARIAPKDVEQAAAAPELPKAAASPAKPPGPPSPVGGSATPRPPSSGDNAVYRIGRDGVPREIFRARALIYALAWQDGRLLVGTGPDGQLYEVRGPEHESAPIARLDNGQILSLLAKPSGAVLVGTGDPGAVVKLSSGYAVAGVLISDVHDTKLISRFGALSWKADTPAGTSIKLQVRSGNVGEPDETWSAWSAEQTAPNASRALVPPGRFAQYRVTLSTQDPATTPELRAVSLSFQTANLPPEITKFEIPDVSAADGATRQARLTVRWDVSDPNGDDLSYTLYLRKEGWPEWLRLGDEHLTGSTFDWDTTAVPPGVYQMRIVASDRPSNNAEDALTREKTSDPFLVDHDAPAVTIATKPRGAVISLKDGYTRLVKAAYAVDGGEWRSIFPDDTLFDATQETITLALPDLKPGAHVLVVRATDAAGNVGTGDALITAP